MRTPDKPLDEQPFKTLLESAFDRNWYDPVSGTYIHVNFRFDSLVAPEKKPVSFRSVYPRGKGEEKNGPRNLYRDLMNDQKAPKKWEKKPAKKRFKQR